MDYYVGYERRMNRAFINGAENISPGFNCHVYLFRPGDTNGTGEKLEYFF